MPSCPGNYSDALWSHMWLFFFWWSCPAGRRGCPQQRGLSRQTRCCRNPFKKNKRTRQTCLGGPLLSVNTPAHIRGGNLLIQYMENVSFKKVHQSQDPKPASRHWHHEMWQCGPPKLKLSAQNGCSMLTAKKSCWSFCVPQTKRVTSCPHICMQCNRVMEWNRMEWNGMGWNEMKWKGMYVHRFSSAQYIYR